MACSFSSARLLRLSEENTYVENRVARGCGGTRREDKKRKKVVMDICTNVEGRCTKQRHWRLQLIADWLAKARQWQDADHSGFMRHGVIDRPQSWISTLAVVLRNRNYYKEYKTSPVIAHVQTRPIPTENPLTSTKLNAPRSHSLAPRDAAYPAASHTKTPRSASTSSPPPSPPSTPTTS